MTIDRTFTGFDVRIGRICATLNRPSALLVPLVKIWRI